MGKVNKLTVVKIRVVGYFFTRLFHFKLLFLMTFLKVTCVGGTTAHLGRLHSHCHDIDALCSSSIIYIVGDIYLAIISFTLPYCEVLCHHHCCHLYYLINPCCCSMNKYNCVAFPVFVLFFCWTVYCQSSHNANLFNSLMLWVSRYI